MDPRTKQLARTITRYCLEAQKGEVVALNTTPTAEPLVVSLYEELLRVGALPIVRMLPEGCTQATLNVAKPDFFTTINPAERAMIAKINASVRIEASSNTHALSSANPKKQAALTQRNRKLMKAMKISKWNVTLFPTAAYAQDADMSLSDFEDFIYSATFSDHDNPAAAWRALGRKQAKLIGKLEGAEQVRIVGPGTDLSFSIKGRTFMNSDGKRNMPSGEVFTGPVEDSAEGFIEYDFPVCHGGREIEGIRLVFKKGLVVEATARKNQSYLRAMIDIDPGARRLGELGIGTNFQIQRFIKHILLDEKIGGTVHLALGQSYAETGGTNKSALHWDMIKDLRKGGELIIDGKVIQKDGKFAKGYF